MSKTKILIPTLIILTTISLITTTTLLLNQQPKTLFQNSADQQSTLSISHKKNLERKYLNIQFPPETKIQTDGNNFTITLNNQTQIVFPVQEEQINTYLSNPYPNTEKTFTTKIDNQTQTAKIYETQNRQAYFFQNFEHNYNTGLLIIHPQISTSNDLSTQQITANFNYTSL